MFSIVGTSYVAEPAHADSVADFYRGRTISLVVGYEPGSGYDILARQVGRFMHDRIPGNPTIVVQNMPGASSIKAANFLYRVAPKDGSVFGAIGRNIPVASLLDPTRVTFDGRKFNWIGSASRTTVVGVSWHTSPVKTIEDAQHTELIVGSPAVGSEATRLPLLYNETLGTKFKVVVGYTEPQIALAMERGEVGGQISWSYDSLIATNGDWIAQKKINLLMQTGFQKDARLPDVPLALDYAKTAAGRQLLEFVFAMYEIARPFAAPPDVPVERVIALRTAFQDTVRNPRFLAEIAKSKIDIVKPQTGEEMLRLIAKEYSAPVTVIERAKQLSRSRP